MSETATTPFSSRCEILADLWMNFRGDEEFEDFIEYNDLGLPLSYAITANLVKATPAGEAMINETFDLLLTSMGLTDEGFENLDEILGL